MKRLFSLIFLLFCCCSLAAQTDFDDSNYQDLQSTRVGLHLVPSTMINFLYRLRGGVQVSRPKWSGIVDVSYGGDWMPNAWENEDGTNGFEDYTFLGIRPELRWNVADIDDQVNGDGLYLGLETAFTFYERLVENDRFELDDEVFEYDRATVQRARHSAIIKVGLNLVTKGGIYFDFYAGAGAAYRQIVYKDIGNLFAIPNGSLFDENLFIPGWKYWKTTVVPDLALGFRIGFYLN